jgi:CHAD domain-containing protein
MSGSGNQRILVEYALARCARKADRCRGIGKAEAGMDVVRRELAEELDRAVRALRQGNRSDRRIHDIRTRLKHCRALLRLLRKSLGEDAYQRENARLRDAARPLVAVRDAAALVQALDGLCPRSTEGTAICGSIRTALRQECRERHEQLRRKALLSSAQLVGGVVQRMRRLPQAQLARADLAKAVKRAYRTSRRAMTVAEQQRSRDRLHEWRKQVKYFASQLKCVSPLMRKGLRNTYEKSLRLADCLGDDHDLALLHDKIIQHRRSGGAAVDALIQRLAQRRAKLQRKAYRRGRRLFGATAGRLEARVRHRLRTDR